MNKNPTITLREFSWKFSEQLSRGNRFTLVEQLRKESMAAAVQPHAHAGWELRLKKDGAWDLIPPNTLHGCNFCRYSIEVDFRHIMITCLDDDTLLNNWRIPNELIPFHLAPELFSMLEHNRENAPLSSRLFEAALFSLLDIFERFSRLPKEHAGHNLADTVCSFLEHRYYHPSLSLEEVALVFGTSSQYLNRVMKAARLPSVHELLTSIRLRKAEHFLRCGAYTIKDVARMTGWSSSLYFSNCFRRRYGCPPGAYRLKIEKEPAAPERRAPSNSAADGGIAVDQTP